MAVTFDLFETLVTVDRLAEPSAAVATELTARDVLVPDDWHEAYREMHVDVPPGAELSLSTHVKGALDSRGITVDGETVERAVVAAFEPEVRTRPGALKAVAAAAHLGPVGILSNCSVPTLVPRTLERSAIDIDSFDAVVSSVDCGWRKPDERAFRAVADALDVPTTDLIHVGDDAIADGGGADVGARTLLLSDVPLSTVPDHLEVIE